MFQEKFMDFGAFSGDFNIRRTSCTNYRFRDLGFGDSPSSSVSNGFCSPDGRSSPLISIVNPFMNDQFKLNMNDEMVGNDLGLCQNLTRISISDAERSVLNRTARFRVDPNGFGSRTVDGFVRSNGNMRRNAEISRLHGGLCNVSSDREGSLYNSRGVPLCGFAGDSDDDSFRSLGLQNDFNPKGFDEIISRDHRDYLLEQRNALYEQRLLNMGTGSCFRDGSFIPQQCESDFNVNKSIQPSFGFYMNDLSNSSVMSGGNKVHQSLLPTDGSGKLGASGLDDSLIIQGSNVKFASECFKNSALNEIDSYSNDVMFESNDNTTGQGLLLSLSLANMVDIYGSIYSMAKDQNGCRFLQMMFDEGTSLEVRTIFDEVIDHVIELALDPFGNYFVQKLLDVCSEEQRMQIVIMMNSKPGQLIRISLNTYGTRVVQKLIETLGTKQQIARVKSALKPGFLSLVRDLNGNHVIQRCLQSLGPEDNKFVFEAATRFCVEIATHRHGCCVLQRCISYAVGPQRDKLIAEISRNSLLLAQDPFGNYVVQYMIEQNVPAANVLSEFKGHYVQLSTQKFSSHVVEKCLRHFPESRSQIVRELVSAPHFEQLLQDPFANYVIQSALSVTKGAVRARLVGEVRAYANLRTSPYCKRIFSRSLLKK